MALQSLDNPLERLSSLPNTMNWRGGWSATEQYYLNDVVVSPVNLASYILNGKTALLNGGDPTTNTDWIELSNTATGVLQVNAGIGLQNTNTPTIVDLENTGVITIAAGNSGIGILNGSGPPYPVNTVISNNGVLSLAPIAGPAGAGIGLSANTGAIQIANNGILGITAGTGLSSTGGQTPTLSVSFPSTTVVSAFVIPNIPLSGITFPAGGSNAFAINSVGASFLETSLNNGVPDPNGSWLFDFTGFTLYASTPPAAGATLTIEFQDTSTGGTYIVPIPEGGELAVYATGVAGPITVQLPNLFIPVAALRAAGITSLFSTNIIITNNTSVVFHTAGNQPHHFATYYPNGLQ